MEVGIATRLLVLLVAFRQAGAQCTVPTVTGASTPCTAGGMMVDTTTCVWTPGAGFFCANCPTGCTATCNVNVFDITPACTAIQCPVADPAVTGSSTMCALSAHGALCPITADLGFSCTGVTVTCTGTTNPGTWTKSGDCTACCGITVSTGALNTAEGGAAQTFTVVLTTAPTDTVSIPVTSGNTAEGTVSPATLSFTTVSFNTPQVVTVTPVQDTIDEDPVTYTISLGSVTSTDAGYSGADPTDVVVTNADDDTAGVTVVAVNLQTTEAGGTTAFTVVLNTQPTATVSIPVFMGPAPASTEGSIAIPTTLTFTTANWFVPQAVTVTGVDDSVDDGDVVYTVVVSTCMSADLKYNAIDPADASITNIDDDTAGVTVTPTAGLFTTEAGGTATFTVVLDSQPTATVTIPVASSNVAEGTVSTASLVFTTANWNVAQQVTITGVDDFIADGATVYTITLGADAGYMIDPPDVTVTNNDNDTPGITLSGTTGLVTTEAGGTASFTIVLNTQPTAAVSIGLSSSLATEGTVAPATLTFTTANWNVAQQVTITGVDDDVDDGDIAYNIITAASSSTDPVYNNMASPDVGVTNTDNDAVGITVVPTTGLVTTEAGGTSTFTVTLASEPTASVTIACASSDTTEGTVGPTTLTFTAANWNTGQVVTVTGVDDAVDDDAIAFTITLTATTTDPAYAPLTPGPVSVTNTDDDSVGITVTATPLTVAETGTTGTYTVVLTSQPTANVEVVTASSDPSEATSAPATLTFTAVNWNVAQVVTVTGEDDFVVDGNLPFTITNGPATGTDPKYVGLTGTTVTGTNNDNDAAGINVNPTTGTTTEAGGTAIFNLILTSEPTANVVITISSSDPSECVAAPGTVTFTSANWNTLQAVTVTGQDDSLDDGDIVCQVVTAAAISTDPIYNTVINPADVAITNMDDDVAGITVASTTTVTTEAGGTATFTVVLAAQPSANVVIPVASSDATEGSVNPASLTFTNANWNTLQTVTVTGVDDFLVDGTIGYTVTLGPSTSPDAAFNTLSPAAPVSLTNTDNDVAGFTVTPTTGLVTTEAGATATFTIVMTSEPTADVSVPFTTSDATEGTVAPATVTFTTANWNVPQVVTITGVNDDVDDGDVVYTITTGLPTTTDTSYVAIDPDNVQVTNTDDDTFGLTVSPVTGTPTEAGGTATFSVQLTTQPTATVTIPLASLDLTEGTVSPASLTFTAAIWNVAQVVTVTGVDDTLDDGNVAFTVSIAAITSSDTSYNGFDAPDVILTNTDDDTVGITVTPTAGLSTTEAGGTTTFTVVLVTQPTADVVIPISSSDATEGIPAPASITFTAADWNVAKVITVTGQDDSVADGDILYKINVDAVTSADLTYNGLNAADVDITNTDNDTPGITVTPTAGTTTEAGSGTTTFQVTLNTEPTAGVTIALTSSDITEGVVTPVSLMFSTTNWNTPQVVTVTGQDDMVDDGDITFTITTGTAVSSDAGYLIDPADVTITNTDDDTRGIIVTPTSGLTTSEAGGTATFSVVLATEPTSTVTIALSTSDASEGSVLPVSLVFTAADWNTAQIATVTGNEDMVDDGDILYTIVTADAVSTDTVYSGLVVPDVTVTNTDDDTAGFTFSKMAVQTTEAGGTDTFTVVLNTMPTATVTVAMSSTNTAEATISSASLTFTTTNWNVPQVITVTGVDDSIDDNDQAYQVTFGATVSTDPKYSGDVLTPITGVNTDDDMAGVIITSTPPLVTTEAGGTTTFNVRLRSQPTSNVVVPVDTALLDATEATVAPNSLTFTPANWMTDQVITVTGVDDNIDDDDVSHVVTLAAATSGDVVYAGIAPGTVTVMNTDDDTAGVTVAPTTGLITSEVGGTAAFTIVLLTEPVADVTLTLSSSDPSEGTISPMSVTFTAANWNAMQQITLTGVQDAIDDGDVAYTIVTNAITSTDVKYHAMNPNNVDATNTDDDTAGITITPTSGLVTTEAGGTATFSVVLRTEPLSDVTIPLSVDDMTEAAVSPVSLTFSAANWNIPQDVTVTGINDMIDDGDKPFNVQFGTFSGADGIYNAITPAAVTGTNQDDETADILVDVSANPLKTIETGTTATFTVKLASQPTADVTVPFVSSDTTEGSVAPTSLVFNSANWNTPAVVTVTGLNDDISDGGIAYQIQINAATSTDTSYNTMNVPDVFALNEDDDVASITATPATGLSTTEMGGTVTFEISISSEPTAPTTVTLTSNDTTEGTVAPASVVFNAVNWKIPQVVTVTGIDDLIDDGNVPYMIVTGIASGGDTAYAGTNPDDVIIINADDETAGITVTPTTGLTTTEAGSTTTFSVVLNTEPTANVLVPVDHCVSGTLTEVTASPCSLTFTTANWQTAQVVTLTGVDELINDGDQVVFIDLGMVSSTDVAYDTMLVPNVTVTNTDDDVKGVTVTPTTGLQTTETGGTVNFSVVLTSMPLSTVTIPIASSNTAEGAISIVNLLFDNNNWNVPQTVVVVGANDLIDDGNQNYQIILSPALSTDMTYSGFNPADVSIVNIDDDTAGISVSKTSFTTLESGSPEAFSVVLLSQPVADVSITIRSGDISEGTVVPASLTFTSANWNTPQQVFVTPMNDYIADGNITYIIETGLATSTDPKYNIMNPGDVMVTNMDDEVAGYVVTPTFGLVTSESGGQATFSIVLTSEPVGDVTLPIATNDTTEGLPTPSVITFTSTTWNVSQVVTVKGADDTIDDGNVVYSIQLLPVSSGDAKYTGMDMADIDVTNTDDDTASIVVAPAPIVTTEAGVKATIQIVLGTRPVNPVTIPVASSDTTEGTTNVPSLTFNAVNWNVPQTVTVTGVDDAVDDGDVIYEITVGPATSTDVPFNGLVGRTVNATNRDDDTAKITVAPLTGLAVKEQGATSATFFVSLSSEPTANVNVPLSTVSVDQIGIAPPVLTFTPANWQTPQQVTVTAVDDMVADGDKTVVAVVGQVTSLDAKYSAMNPDDVVITVADNDAAGLLVTPLSGLVTSEPGGTATFTVALSSEPVAVTTVAITSSNVMEGTVNSNSLTFTPATWNITQIVTVTGVQDLLQDGNIIYGVQVGPASSTDTSYNSVTPVTVSVTNTDDDTAGITLSPSTGLTTSEDGSTTTFTVVLNTKPTANASFSVASTDLSEGTLDLASLIFTPNNWNFRQMITITGVDDVQRDGDITYGVTVTPTGSTDPFYNNIAAVTVQVVNMDNEVPGVQVSPLVITVTEWGNTADFTVVLLSPPTSIVTIPVSSTDTTEGTVSPASLSFSAANWNIEQRVTVTGVDDTIDDGDISFIVQLGNPMTTDTAYALINPADVTVANIDDDPNRPPVCSTFSSLVCTLRADAASVLCPAAGCDEATCCRVCSTFSSAACRSKQLIANAATTRCPPSGCDSQTCCLIVTPPPGAVVCTQHTGSCQLVSDAAFVQCPAAGCDDVTCCNTCASFNATQCPTRLLRSDYRTAYCGFRGCDTSTCCKPDICFGVFCSPLSQCHEAGACGSTSGLCTTPLKLGGSPCDDGNAATVNDTCDAAGLCRGQNKCNGVVCTAKSSCHDVGSCDPTTGLCTEPIKVTGTVCNDGLPETIDDTCRNGACAGTVQCVGGTCTPSEPQCHTSGCGVQGGTGNQPLKCIDLPKLDGTPCDDGIIMTTNDRCLSGKCVGVELCKNTVCTARTQCHAVGTCSPSSGLCSTPLLVDGTPCDDNNLRTRDDMCYKGECIGKDKCLGIICRASTQCHTAGVCDSATGLCTDPPIATGTSCNDGDSSTTNDRCDGAGACVGTLPCAPCTASEPQCHIARCGDGGACTEIGLPDNTQCNDGFTETFDDKCVAGRCAGRLLCDGAVCTADQCHIPGECDVATGRCSTPVKPDNTPCNDGKDDTRNDVCISGVCVGTSKCSGVTCPASDACHGTGTCNPSTGLCSDPLLRDGTTCDDGDDDTTDDSCQSGICTGTTQCGGITCTATEPQCRRSYCAANRCAEVMKSDGTTCNDNNAETTGDKCVQGMCVGTALCANVQCPVTNPCRGVSKCDVATGLCSQVGPTESDGTPCDDGQLNTVSDRCIGGTCVGSPVCDRVTCMASDQCHEAGTCNPLTGLCSSPSKPDGAVCNDGNQQTADDKCVSGACLGTISCAGITCVPSEPQCMRAACNGNICTEIAKPDNSFCDDGLPETLDDKCQNGVCVGTNRCAGIVCVAASQCRDIGDCHPLTGVCTTPTKADGSTCNDGITPTVDDKCMKGICVGVDKCAGVVCSTQICKGSSSCDPVTGQCTSQPLPDGSSCNDGDGATVNDVCMQGICTGTVTCNGVQCAVTEPQCYTATCTNNQCQEILKQENTPCNDGNANTVGDKCVAGVCTGVDNCANVACVRKGQCYNVGTCDPLTGQCTNPTVTDGSVCDDSLSSTTNDVCSNGVCRGKGRCEGVICTASDSCHEVGVCDASSGLCSDPAKAQGTPCNDGNPLTLSDTCTSGTCTGTVTCNSQTCTAASPECNFATCNGAACSQTMKPNGTPCNDKNPNTFNDMCTNGVCAGRDKCLGVTCATNSTNPCIMPGTCEPASGVCTAVLKPDGSQCNDGDQTTTGDTCKAGVCIGVNKCAGVTCTASDMCHTVGLCDFLSGLCSDPIRSNGVACDDGNDFSINDQCRQGVCLGTTVCNSQSSPCPVSNAQCNVAACDNGQCVELAKPDGTVCNDGDGATSNDVCKAGVCKGISKCDNVACPAGMCNEAGTCDPTTGQCVSNPKSDGVQCDDKDPTTISDVCTSGVCRGKSRCSGVVCGGGTDCRAAGVCDTNTGTCTYAAVTDNTPCNDGSANTVDDKCTGGVCTGSVACVGQMCRVADAQCNTPACNANQCVELSKPENTPCDDGKGLTFDDVCKSGVCTGVQKCALVICSALSNCHHVGTCEPSTGICSTPIKADGTSCDDGNPLTMTSECFGGVCVSSDKCVGQSPCVAQSECHEVGTCDPSTGQCSNPVKPDGTLCDDRILDTQDDQCKAGVCVGTQRCAGVVCTASDGCHTAGVCDPNTGLCSDPLRPDGTSCDDGNPLTQGESCAGGQCWGQGICAGVPCSTTGPQCKVATCTGSQCIQAPKADGTKCNDGDVLTLNDACFGGVCRGTSMCANKNCPETQCQNTGTCDPGTGKCTYAAKQDGTQCDDGDSRTYNDACANGRCVGQQKCNGVACSPRSSCHTSGVCDMTTGRCSEPVKATGTSCEDGNAATTNDQCAAGICQGTLVCGNVLCSNSNPQCATTSCVNNRCVETLKQDGTACDDKNALTIDDKCAGGVCTGTDPCRGVACTAISQCHDAGVCEPLTGRCTNPLKSNRSPCNDGSSSTVDDVCMNGICSGKDKCSGVVCGTSDQCHDRGTCDPTTGICSDPISQPEGIACNDGDAKTIDDRCATGTCYGTLLCGTNRCRSTSPCRTSVCSANTCDEQALPDGTICNDNDATTMFDRCTGGVCKGTNPCAGVACTAASQCHEIGVCDPRIGLCSSVPLPDGTGCDDQNSQTTNDQCFSGSCAGVAKCANVACVATDNCHDPGICDPFTGLCSEPPKPSGEACDDGDPSTANDRCVNGMCVGSIDCGGSQCTASSACMVATCVSNKCSEIARPDNTPCNDNNPATFSDKCIGGTCTSVNKCTGVICVPRSSCHSTGVCDPSTGRCTSPIKPDTTPCNDNNPNTVDDACSKGVCIGVDKCRGVVCTASDECHSIGACNPSTGLCSDPVKPGGSRCDDGNPDTTDDRCNTGACTGTVTCRGVSGCTAQQPMCMMPTCAADQCIQSNKPDGTTCNDANPGTTNDVCLSGLCTGNKKCASVVCVAQDQCHSVGACNEITGECSNPIQTDGLICDDGNPQTVGDECILGVCVGRDKCAGVICKASDSCHDPGSCDPATGLCTDPKKIDNSLCNDMDVTTTDDKCAGGVCSGVVQCGARTCRPNNPGCMKSSCSAGQCIEIPRPDGIVCNDGQMSTLNDVCLNGACVGTDPCAGVVCQAMDQCHYSGDCEVATGKCTNPVKPDGTACDDGLTTTTKDICMNGLCKGTPKCSGVICPSGPCVTSVGVCDVQTGICSSTKRLDGTLCDDLNPLTKEDRCANGKCEGAIPKACGTYTGTCTLIINPNATLCPAWTGCTADICCRRATCNTFAVTACSLRADAATTLCPVAGCDTATCCGTCASEADVTQCSTREVHPTKVCPSGGCSPTECCTPGTPLKTKVAVDVRGQPLNLEAAAVALANALGLPRGSITEAAIVLSVNGTSRVVGVATQSSNNPDGTIRDPTAHASALMSQGKSSINTQPPNVTWNSVGEPIDLVAYPDGTVYPAKCSSAATLNHACGSNSQYGCPLTVTCERGMTPCCSDPDGKCDDGDDKVACAPYTACPAAGTKTRICGAVNTYGCTFGVTCASPTETACCSDADGSCTDGDDDVSCTAPSNNECTSVGNTVCSNAVRGVQTCNDPSESFGDWRCTCTAPKTGQAVAGEAVCAAPANEKDIFINVTGTNETQVSDEIAAMLGVARGQVVATTNGAAAGKMRLILPTDALRTSFLDKSKTCASNVPPCAGTSLTGVDVVATACTALQEKTICEGKSGCLYENNVCRSAAANTPGATPSSDDDDSGVPLWAIILGVAGLLLCLLILCILLSKSGSNKNNKPPVAAEPLIQEPPQTPQKEVTIYEEPKLAPLPQVPESPPPRKASPEPIDDPFNPLAPTPHKSILPPLPDQSYQPPLSTTYDPFAPSSKEVKSGNWTYRPPRQSSADLRRLPV